MTIFFQDFKEEIQQEIFEEMKDRLGPEIEEAMKSGIDQETAETEIVDDYLNTHNFGIEVNY